jgi:hypothetical protein
MAIKNAPTMESETKRTLSKLSLKRLSSTKMSQSAGKSGDDHWRYLF